jgi:hypothetical protein
MPSSNVDRNLLFGCLALQNNFISREELITAVSAWLVDKSRALDEILRERGALAEEQRKLVGQVSLDVIRQGLGRGIAIPPASHYLAA